MHLPNAGRAVVERSKVEGYLLALNHLEGGGKAAFFMRFGFTADRWHVLAEALRSHAEVHPVRSTTHSEYGTKYQVDGPIICPDGRLPMIRAVWIVDVGADIPRLVTAYPL